MIALTGTYHKGQLVLDSPVKAEKPLKVIVTFLEEDIVPEQKANLAKTKFSFEQSRALLKDYKGSFSEAVIEERNED